ncbi:thiamine diphosphokinase [Thalassococcus sp. S3]|uniref:thiamine diphosphokinase n=1 Tax=Thalassococcus sp. S3 TaxID=2017482 RepID=UPI0010243FC5|nr:thiamine diphosphokinase [Thalassococcus sp. S3]QBF32748.1 thiamine diphosphokinase [Thalassococcus sp. S3]
MIRAIVNSRETVTLVGGGEAAPDDVLDALIYGRRLVAADGGARLALQAGHVPEAVIGDFDSISAEDRAAIPPERFFQINEQDSTDFDKALRNVSAPLVLAVGFLGARVDHQLAAFHTLVRHPDRPCILVGTEDVTILAPPCLTVDLSAGDIVSLFPMGEVGGRSEGLQWPIDELRFAPDDRIGTSNRATGKVTLSFDTPRMLLILPRARLPQLIEALPPQTWPKPAPRSARA